MPVKKTKREKLFKLKGSSTKLSPMEKVKTLQLKGILKPTKRSKRDPEEKESEAEPAKLSPKKKVKKLQLKGTPKPMKRSKCDAEEKSLRRSKKTVSL